MIVNCFHVFRTLNLNFSARKKSGLVDGPALTGGSIARLVESLSTTFEWGEDFHKDAEVILVLDGEKQPGDCTELTGAEIALLATIVEWLSVEIGDTYCDGWGMNNTALKHFVFENHNRAIGVMLIRSDS